MNTPPRRPLSLDGRRAFKAVARRLSFSAAADGLFLTQSAISRQIKALETELGAALFTRAIRKVEIAAPGGAVRQAVLPALDGIDRVVRQIRVSKGRRHVNLSSFARFTTLGLMPRLAGLQQQHGEWLSPVVSPFLTRQAASGQAPPLATVVDPAGHALLAGPHRPAHA